MVNRCACWFSLAWILVVVACGCVERKEHLTISPTGSVHYQIAYTSDSLDDLYEGDAVPRIAGGWAAEQIIQKDEDGKKTFQLLAQAAFPPGKTLPSNYALRTDADHDLYLQFPTTLTIEQRRDGTYYHFARVYSARPWAKLHALQERLVEEPLQELKGIEHAQWSPAQRQMVARALAAFEVERMLLFARTAYRAATPDSPQDGWLAAQHAMRDCLNHFDYASIAELLKPRDASPEDDARQEQAVTAELQGITDSLHDHLKQSLMASAGYNGAQYNRFRVEYDRQKKLHDVTEDLGDDRFEIKVEMPGEIVASNADSTAGSTAEWTFDGQLLRDAALELLVTSRIAK